MAAKSYQELITEIQTLLAGAPRIRAQDHRTVATDIVDTLFESAGGYKSYTFTATQSGGSAPSITPYKNTLGGNPTWSYGGTGSYEITLAGAFPALKVVSPQHQTGAINKNTDDAYYIYFERISDDVCRITTRDSSFAPSDNLLQDKFFELRVYR